jgi:pantoate--beta-alanine ligase
MSSRNALLSAEERAAAAHIPAMMQEAKAIYNSKGIEASKWYVQEAAAVQALMQLDYYKICDRDTLQELSQAGPNAIALIAVFVGKIRLIDNLFL